MQTIRLDVDALEVRSFATTRQEAANGDTDPDRSAISETNGVYICKSCGPCCQ